MVIEKDEAKDDRNERAKIYVCGACGRYADTREGLTDISCYMGAIAIYEDSAEMVNNRVIAGVFAND